MSAAFSYVLGNATPVDGGWRLDDPIKVENLRVATEVMEEIHERGGRTELWHAGHLIAWIGTDDLWHHGEGAPA